MLKIFHLFQVVLCSVSDYFAELLVPNSATRYQQRLYVNETSSEILQQLIDYAYTAKIEISGKFYFIKILYSAVSL